ncbi:hypothetical protein FFLO_02242 [Filobasidium floriforme]|uniref:Uncharacterized protein n=1 Tax=Filobasidium floriforme TaxID=5210 RepID=A0A8K0JN17_9TREE|nr:uncharacterized protein HD553DRAFT_364613 [Filobasidium floriforme]KAG7562350.1 hypothetical protein FFLO_02242 [Filobasidium floriforme]KAH8077949.1 hypothetical protein HD553DRAFT_364613 [Filobasidium floriforme]
MEPHAPLSDLHAAASYVSEKLRAYICEEAGFGYGVGIPHAFAGSWEVRALSEGLGGAAGEGFEEIICLTPASNRHLRQAFHAQPHHCLSPLSPTSASISTLSSESHPLASPTEPTYFSSPPFEHSPGFNTGYGYGYGYTGNGYSTSGSDEEGKSVELHCHPKSGVPMTVIVDLGAESVSGKKVRIDMLQAGEYGPRKLYAPTSAGNAPLWEIMDLPFLSPTEFVRAKLRCNREYWDLGDISWMASLASSLLMINYSEHLDLNRLSIDEVEEFVHVQQDEQTCEVWARLKETWGV